ncbi:hypothetical protein D3C77_273150 [compost metagenome]
MKVARRPTTTPSASMWIHFFSTSAGFSEAVVLFSMMRVLETKNAARASWIERRTC